MRHIIHHSPHSPCQVSTVRISNTPFFPLQTDIRIIDFAEFQKEGEDGKTYDEPDAGFLLGLRTLAGILESMLEKR